MLQKNINALTKYELQTLLCERGVPYPTRLRKQELVDLLAASQVFGVAQGGEEEDEEASPRELRARRREAQKEMSQHQEGATSPAPLPMPRKDTWAAGAFAWLVLMIMLVTAKVAAAAKATRRAAVPVSRAVAKFLARLLRDIAQFLLAMVISIAKLVHVLVCLVGRCFMKYLKHCCPWVAEERVLTEAEVIARELSPFNPDELPGFTETDFLVTRRNKYSRVTAIDFRPNWRKVMDAASRPDHYNNQHSCLKTRNSPRRRRAVFYLLERNTTREITPESEEESDFQYESNDDSSDVDEFEF